MSKGIIVVDMPENCRNVKAKNGEGGCQYGGIICMLTGKDVMKHNWNGEKPDWCPIKPMPEKKSPMEQTVSPIITEQYEPYDRGWNECIDEIFKEKCNE